MEAIEAAGRAYLASLSCPISAKCAQFSTALKMCTEAQFSVALSRAFLYSTFYYQGAPHIHTLLNKRGNM